MRKFTILSLALAAMLLVAGAVIAAPKAPEDAYVKLPEGATKTQQSIKFSHKAHDALDCTACHHEWDGKGDIKSCSTDGCHTDMKERRGGGSYYAAFHAPQSTISCMGCHRVERQAGKTNVPTACTACHPKAE